MLYFPGLPFTNYNLRAGIIRHDFLKLIVFGHQIMKNDSCRKWKAFIKFSIIKHLRAIRVEGGECRKSFINFKIPLNEIFSQNYNIN